MFSTSFWMRKLEETRSRRMVKFCKVLPPRSNQQLGHWRSLKPIYGNILSLSITCISPRFFSALTPFLSVPCQSPRTADCFQRYHLNPMNVSQGLSCLSLFYPFHPFRIYPAWRDCCPLNLCRKKLPHNSLAITFLKFCLNIWKY